MDARPWRQAPRRARIRRAMGGICDATRSWKGRLDPEQPRPGSARSQRSASANPTTPRLRGLRGLSMRGHLQAFFGYAVLWRRCDMPCEHPPQLQWPMQQSGMRAEPVQLLV